MSEIAGLDDRLLDEKASGSTEGSNGVAQLLAYFAAAPLLPQRWRLFLRAARKRFSPESSWVFMAPR